MNEKLSQDMHARFDKLEEKLDKYAEQTTKNTQDISWISGNLKIGMSALITLLGAGVSLFIKIFTSK